MNALHLCAIFDAAPAADVLLGTRGIDVDAKTKLGDTALSLAAARGSVGVLASLIRKGADLHRGGALSGAVSARQLDAVLMLVDAGAGVRFKTSRGLSVNILHHAVCTDEKRPSHVRKLLAKCPQARATDVINQFDSNGWTPLHQAAYFGDFDGTAALLEAGADPGKFRTPTEHSMGGTPLQLATRIRESDMLFTHPRARQELSWDTSHWDRSGLPLDRGENIFKDYLDEIIRMLRRAEVEVSSQETLSSSTASATPTSDSLVLVERPSESSA